MGQTRVHFLPLTQHLTRSFKERLLENSVAAQPFLLLCGNEGFHGDAYTSPGKAQGSISQPEPATFDRGFLSLVGGPADDVTRYYQ